MEEFIKEIEERIKHLQEDINVVSLAKISELTLVNQRLKQLLIQRVSQQRELLKAFGKWYNGCTLSNPINMKNIDNYINSL